MGDFSKGGRATKHREFLKTYLPPILVTLLAMALQLYGLDSKSLWFDELATLTGAGWEGSWLDSIQKPLTIPITPKPPLSYVVTHLFLLLGDQVFFLRFPSTLFATLTIPLTYVLGRTLFDRQVGLLGAFLLALAPLHLRYAQEARMYAMWTFFSLLSLYLFWRAVRSQDARWWILFAAVTILALYTHLFALLALGVVTLFALLLLVRPRTRAQFPFQSRHFAVALAVILLAYVPMLPFLTKGLVSGEGLGGEAAPSWDLSVLMNALGLFSAGNATGSVIYVFLLAVGAVVLARKSRKALILAIMWIALPFIFVLSLPFGHNVRIRYFLVALPFYLLVVAYGLCIAAQWVAPRASHLMPRLNLKGANALVSVILLGILVVISAPSIAAYYAETKQNWRDATQLVCTLAEPGDQIFVRHVYHQVGVLFYARHLCGDPTIWTEANVQVFSRSLAGMLSPDDYQKKWLIVPHRDEFLPGGSLEASIQPHHHLLPPTVFRALRVPKEWGIIAPTAFRTLAVVPVVPSKPASFRLWVDDDSLAPGDCTWLHWQVEEVREVYLDGEGVAGHDQRQVCPSATTRYELEIVHLDGTQARQAIEISVHTP